jgi:hypothetical protein
MEARYQIKRYFIVETEDVFLKSIAKEIFKNVIILEIWFPEYGTIRLKGGNDYRVFDIPTLELDKCSTVLEDIQFYPN